MVAMMNDKKSLVTTMLLVVAVVLLHHGRVMAQDDMYFTPIKQTKEMKAAKEKTRNEQKAREDAIRAAELSEEAYYSGISKNTDEYNRRKGYARNGKNVVATADGASSDSLASDVISFNVGSLSDTISLKLDTLYNVDNDYQYSRQMVRFYECYYDPWMYDRYWWHRGWWYSPYYTGWYAWGYDPWFDPWYDPWYGPAWYGPGWYNPWMFHHWYRPVYVHRNPTIHRTSSDRWMGVRMATRVNGVNNRTPHSRTQYARNSGVNNVNRRSTFDSNTYTGRTANQNTYSGSHRSSFPSGSFGSPSGGSGFSGPRHGGFSGGGRGGSGRR